MAYDEKQAEHVTKQLESFGKFETKKMFGGLGYFRDGRMFGVIMHGAFRLKGDEETSKDYAAYGFGKHKIPGKKMEMPYYEVPEEILEDKKKLKAWAEKAYGVALKAKKKKK